ncbi:hypothetical protein F2P81_023455 [Scophthalmus maximus]|uniref:Uncharacterized protein n=1 Tax=Scophthalmus maximus TaxID=52904 RepID=A0A6A4RRK6_SCOMX|nr:hypothetical protein F2P81_023455 [Scophthalmus maximus]
MFHFLAYIDSRLTTMANIRDEHADTERNMYTLTTDKMKENIGRVSYHFVVGLLTHNTYKNNTLSLQWLNHDFDFMPKPNQFIDYVFANIERVMVLEAEANDVILWICVIFLRPTFTLCENVLSGRNSNASVFKHFEVAFCYRYNAKQGYGTWMRRGADVSGGVQFPPSRCSKCRVGYKMTDIRCMEASAAQPDISPVLCLAPPNSRSG